MRPFRAAFFILKYNQIIVSISNFNFIIVFTFLYIVWIFVYGSFHFADQTQVYRNDHQTLLFKKGSKTVEIKKQDISTIYIQLIKNYKMGQVWFKILCISDDNQKYRFTHISSSMKLSNDIIEDFLQETENFWGIGNREKVFISPNFFFCN